MRPLGVTLIAAVTWCMGAFWALVGLSIIGFSHLGARMLSAMTEGTGLQRFTVGVGTVFGAGVLLLALFYAIVGFGLWKLKNWARVITLVFVGIGVLFGLRSLIEYHYVFRMLRTVLDAVILIYLLLPGVSRLFA
jgi:hypothetical protein